MMTYRQLYFFLLLCLFIVDFSRAQAVGEGIRIDLSEQLSLDTDSGQFAQLFISEYFQPSMDGRFTLVFHLHGASWAAENQVCRAQANAIVFNIHLGSFSRSYQDFFLDENIFQTILDTILVKLERRRILLKPIVQYLIISSFSAGYAGVRELLKHDKYYNKIKAIHLADGLHATSNTSIMEEQMKDFVRFARDARDEEKIMYLTHSSIPTPGYESTTSTANYLIKHIGSKRQTISNEDEIGIQYSQCDSGYFNLQGYLGETADDHMKHLYAMHLMIKNTIKKWNKR